MTFSETGIANKTGQAEGIPYLKHKECLSITWNRVLPSY